MVTLGFEVVIYFVNEYIFINFKRFSYFFSIFQNLKRESLKVLPLRKGYTQWLLPTQKKGQKNYLGGVLPLVIDFTCFY